MENPRKSTWKPPDGQLQLIAHSTDISKIYRLRYHSGAVAAGAENAKGGWMSQRQGVCHLGGQEEVRNNKQAPHF